MRLTQALFLSTELRLMCYVDDPLAIIRGTEDERNLIAAIIILVWEALGFGLAYPKGQLSHKVTWIGGTIEIHTDSVTAEVKQSIISDICDDLAKILKSNLVARKVLHSLVGKLNHVAGLLVVIRPYLEPLWAALYKGSRNKATIWTKQIMLELQWFHVLFTSKTLPIIRVFTLSAFLRTGTVVEIGTDASLWGMGGWLSINGAITHYFASPISKDDSRILPVEGKKGQQVWECLAILVAIRLWAHLWAQDRMILRVRGDNIGALTLLVKLRPPTKSPAMGIIARELALDLAQLSFQPEATHTPGLSHVVADLLSRVFSPTGSGTVSSALHPALANAELTDVPNRNENWYRAYRARKAKRHTWARQ